MKSPRSSGFTLIEMLVAIVLIAIIVAMSLPTIRMSAYRADAAMRIVQRALLQAQRTAIHGQHDVIVRFDIAKASLIVHHDVNNNRASDGVELVRTLSLEEGNRFAAPPTGIQGFVASAVVGRNLTTVGGLPAIIFRRDGAASTDLEVYVTSSSDEPRDWRALTVSRSTARVQPFRYSSLTWRESDQ